MNKFDGFHEFVVARGGALSRTAFLLTGEHHAAEDLVQSALAKAAVRWRQIMEYGQPEAYIRRTMINEHISWWRRRPARPMAELPELPGPDEPRQVVDRVVLGRALDTLTAKQRAVVVLRYYEDLTEAETAAAMGCSIGTVKSQTHTALGKLRSALPMFAEQAGAYADAEAALTRARTSRSRRIAVGAALAVLPLGLVAALFALRGGDSAPPPLTPTPSPSASALPLLPPLPTRLPEAADPVAALPRDRGIGIATLLRVDGQTTPITVDVLAGGEWFRTTVPQSPTTRSLFPAELSPDGRWLVRITGAGAVVRDLTGTAEWTVPGVRLPRWSPSGARLAGYRLDGRVAVQSTADGTRFVSQPRREGWSWAGVLDSGELVQASATGRAGDTALEVELLDLAAGTARRFTADLGVLMKPDERLPATRGPVARVFPAAGGELIVEVQQASRAGRISGYVTLSAVDGRPLRRYDLPPEAYAGGSPAGRACLRGTELLWAPGRQVQVVPQDGSGAGWTLDRGAVGLLHIPGCPEYS
ncbi:SigE family RNA polymerase sigma factor [Catellatospora sp. NPDC049609]|uniref:SigE family RNA polymerase sigma factor n=1 Tax=Catellatospora sp. NPDC049609 TaxID=3155505 RepID=UPI00343A7100